MTETAPQRANTFRAWLDALSDWQFTGTMYLLRWVVILPLALVLSPISSPHDTFQAEGTPWHFLIPFLFVAPTLETLIECSMTYWLMYGVLKRPRRSPWPFVIASATLMVLLHPIQPVVVVMAFTTGAFLAYVYDHFAPRSHLKAFLHTAVFHGGINAVGWTMMLFGTLT